MDTFAIAKKDLMNSFTKDDLATTLAFMIHAQRGAMQGQVLVAVPKSEQTQQDVAVSIVEKLESPYNLFINVKQLLDPEVRYVYFFIYIFGHKRVALWGLYDKHDAKFIVDGGCRYRTAQLMKMVNTWKRENFSYAAHVVRNRSQELFKKYLDQESKWINNYDDYLLMKHHLGFFKGLTDINRYPKEYEELMRIFEQEYNINPLLVSPDDEEYRGSLEEFMGEIESEIAKYEKNINSANIDSFILRTAKDGIQKITDLFKTRMESGEFESNIYYSSLEECPALEYCDKTEFKDGCQVYYYGSEDNEGYYSDIDPRALL